MRLKMVIADSDQSYLSALEEYFQNNHLDRYNLSFFSRKDYLLDFLQKEKGSIDILLVKADLFIKELEMMGIKKIILLSEGKIHQEVNNHPIVNKYQSCDVLLGRVIDIFTAENNFYFLPLKSGDMKCQSKIISIYSPAGGVGKTTVAIAMATLLAQMGRRVFYLNFEETSSLAMYFPKKGEYNASNLFYSLKNQKKNIILKLESMQIKDYSTQISYIESPESPLEWEEMRGEEIEYFLSELRKSGMYDYIILDLSSNFDTKNIKMMSLSQHIFALITPDLTSKFKGEEFIKQLDLNPQFMDQIPKKILWIMNRSKDINKEINIGGKEIVEQLPESRELWVKRDATLILKSNSDFAKALNGILIKIDQ